MAKASTVPIKPSTATAKSAKKIPAAGAASVEGKRGIDILHDPTINRRRLTLRRNDMLSAWSALSRR